MKNPLLITLRNIVTVMMISSAASSSPPAEDDFSCMAAVTTAVQSRTAVECRGVSLQAFPDDSNGTVYWRAVTKPEKALVLGQSSDLLAETKSLQDLLGEGHVRIGRCSALNKFCFVEVSAGALVYTVGKIQALLKGREYMAATVEKKRGGPFSFLDKGKHESGPMPRIAVTLAQLAEIRGRLAPDSLAARHLHGLLAECAVVVQPLSQELDDSMTSNPMVAKDEKHEGDQPQKDWKEQAEDDFRCDPLVDDEVVMNLVSKLTAERQAALELYELEKKEKAALAEEKVALLREKDSLVEARTAAMAEASMWQRKADMEKQAAASAKENAAAEKERELARSAAEATAKSAAATAAAAAAGSSTNEAGRGSNGESRKSLEHVRIKGGLTLKIGGKEHALDVFPDEDLHSLAAHTCRRLVISTKDCLRVVDWLGAEVREWRKQHLPEERWSAPPRRWRAPLRATISTPAKGEAIAMGSAAFVTLRVATTVGDGSSDDKNSNSSSSSSSGGAPLPPFCCVYLDDDLTPKWCGAVDTEAQAQKLIDGKEEGGAALSDESAEMMRVAHDAGVFAVGALPLPVESPSGRDNPPTRRLLHLLCRDSEEHLRTDAAQAKHLSPDDASFFSYASA